MARVALLTFLICSLIPQSGIAADAKANAALVKACNDNLTSEAKQALKNGADPNAVDPGNHEPVLHRALWHGSPGLVNLLLEAGAKATEPNEYGWTALHAAASAYISDGEQNAVANLRRILATGVDVHHKGNAGWDALALAAGNHPALVKILLAAGARVSPLAVAAAVEDCNVASLDLVLAAGGDLTAPLPGGRTMMHAACARVWRRSNSEPVGSIYDRLFAAGLKTDVPDDTGLTPLLLAASNANREAIVWLLAHGANLKATDNAGRNALLAAVNGELENKDCIVQLIDAGCPLSAVGKSKQTALETALHRRVWDLAALLLRRGAEVKDARKTLRDALLTWHDTPASPAATRSIVVRLLRRLPNANGIIVHDRPLLHELVFLNEESLVSAAIKAGVDINERDAMGRTALMWAAILESETMQSTLCAAGADATLRDAGGKTAAELSTLFQQPVPEPDPPPVAPPPPTDLFDAVAAGDIAAAERFIAADKTAVEAERLGLRPIHLSALNGQKDAAALLVRHGADLTVKSAGAQTPFVLAATAGQAAWFRWFVEQAAAGSRPGLIAEAARLSLEHRHLSLAKELLALGWKPEPKEAANLIVAAVESDDAGLVRKLISITGGTPSKDANADPFAGDETRDVLEWAVRRDAGNSMLPLLLSATAAKQPEKWRGRVNAAFVTAILSGNLTAAREFVKTGLTDPAAPNHFGKPALNIAASQGHREIVQFLLEIGHKPEAGTGVLRAAAEFGNAEIAGLLIKSGASLDEGDKNSDTALHVAVRLGHHPVAEKLLAAGASLTVRNDAGLTPANVAEDEGYLDLADALRARAEKK